MGNASTIARRKSSCLTSSVASAVVLALPVTAASTATQTDAARNDAACRRCIARRDRRIGRCVRRYRNWHQSLRGACRDAGLVEFHWCRMRFWCCPGAPSSRWTADTMAAVT